MKIFYFVHITGTDTGISGVARVVRNLARELVGVAAVEFVPVCWGEETAAIVHAEQKLLDNLSRNNGPELAEAARARQPIQPSPGDWLLIAEVPHLHSHYPGFPSVHLDALVGYAVGRALKVAIVFHDILPLIFGVGGKQGQPFIELSPADLRARADNNERLAFARYAHAAALVDLVLPVSRTAGDSLREWLVQHGHRPERLPPIAPALLPEEIFGAKRAAPADRARSDAGPIEFVALGLVNAQKNQLAAMAGFLRLLERRPDLDLRLNLVGLVASDVAVPVSLLAKRAKGRIVLHGRLSDGQIRDLTHRARATVFLSLAEGYGLPVAESLWRGKPCLCSNAGSIAEIARGGGCLTVDPRDIDAIAAGFETLATDSVRYAELLRELAERPFKTWAGYAGQLVDALSAVAAGWAPEIAEGGRPAAPAGPQDETDAPRDSMFVIAAADLAVNGAFASANRSRSLYYGGAIHYDAALDGAVDEEVLFFGPYVSLPAGRYAFTLEGELDGELRLMFTAQDGATRIVETTVASFDAPIVFELTGAVERFEIVGARTPQLRRLTLRGAFGARSACAAEVEAEMAGGGPGLPITIAAWRMRVHDAFGSGQANQLRDGAAIAFDRAAHGGVSETTLFFGPYIRLEPGRYSVRFDGELRGSLNLRLTSESGRRCLRELVLTSFEAPVVMEVEEAAEGFEAVANRRDDTEAVRLTAIEISQAASAAVGEDKGGESARQRSRGSLLARVLGRT